MIARIVDHEKRISVKMYPLLFLFLLVYSQYGKLLAFGFIEMMVDRLDRLANHFGVTPVLPAAARLPPPSPHRIHRIYFSPPGSKQ